MSSSLATHTQAADQALVERPARFRLPSPAIVLTLLLLLLILLRLPSALLPRELNVDESLFLSQAMKFSVNPRPWVAGDVTSSGPLSAYFLSIFLLLGFTPGFVLLHMLGAALVCLQVVVTYLTLRRLASERIAALGALLMVLVYGLNSKPEYLHFTGEFVPTLLLMAGFYLFVEWLGLPPGVRSSTQIFLLFLAGLPLGAAPWCKIQAVPITGALGLVVLVAIFRLGATSSLLSRFRQALAFILGATLTTCIMLFVLEQCGGMKDFWASYILNNLAYAGGMTLAGSIVNCFIIFLISPLNQLLLVGLCLLAYASTSEEHAPLDDGKKWALRGLVVYAGSALFAVSRPAIPLVPPCDLSSSAYDVPGGELRVRQYGRVRRRTAGP